MIERPRHERARVPRPATLWGSAIIEPHVYRKPRRIIRSQQEVKYLAGCLARGEISTAEFLKGINI